jgi:hypothetical protein
MEWHLKTIKDLSEHRTLSVGRMSSNHFVQNLLVQHQGQYYGQVKLNNVAFIQGYG